jgi:hypothetical protein
MKKWLSLLLLVLVQQQQQHNGVVQGQRTLVSLSKKLKILRDSDKKASNSNPTVGADTLKGKGYARIAYVWNRLWDASSNDDTDSSKGFILTTATTVLLLVLAAASVMARQAMLLQSEYYSMLFLLLLLHTISSAYDD